MTYDKVKVLHYVFASILKDIDEEYSITLIEFKKIQWLNIWK